MVGELFPPSRELLANYDWVDINNSTGYIKFDCYNTEDSVGTNYTLIHSDYGKYLQPRPSSHDVVGAVDAAFTKKFDFDYDDSVLKLPTTLYGKCSVKMAYYLTSGTTKAEGYVIVKLRKWNAGTTTETEIASVQSPTDEADSIELEAEQSLEFDVPRTLIKRGEQIRITIELWARHTAPGVYTVRMVGDPQDAAYSTYLSAGNTRITVILPFHIVI